MFELSEVRPLQQSLMFLDGAANLSLFTIEISQDEMNLQRIAGGLGGGAQFLDRGIDLVGHQKVQTQHVMRGLTRPASIDPPPVLELVSLPCLADGEARQKSEQDEERDVGTHQSPGTYSRRTLSHRFCARR